MLDIEPSNTSLDTLGSWTLGTGVVLTILAGAVMAAIWTGGISFASARAKAKGQTGVILTILGCLVLSSIGGGIKYSTTDASTEDLLPEAAKQRTIKVDRKAPTSKCESMVAITSEKHLGAKDDDADDKEGEKYKPSEAEAGKMGKAIRNIGADKWEAEKVWTKSLQWGGRIGDIPSKKDWKENRDKYEEKHSPMYSRVQWLPDGKEGKCDNTNFHAAKGAPVEVIFWEMFDTPGSSENFGGRYGYRMFRIPVK